MSKFYCVFLCLCFCLNSFGQEKLFTNSDAEIPLLTHSHNHQIALFLNLSHFNSIKNSNPCEFQIQLPFFEGDTINLYLESFDVFTNDFQLLRNTENGLVLDDYKPIIKSYRIKDSEGWTGSISFMKNYLIGVVKKSGKVYEIKYFQDGVYILYDVNASISESNFMCQTDTDDFVLPNNNAQPLQLSGGPECLEMGIEIDNYTYNEFNGNCYEAVEWSLALLAGVNEVYMSELNDIVTLQARYVNVWEIVDNYDPLNDCGDMLDEMPNYWTNPPFDDIYSQTDLVHLFSQKNANGGIAWVGALCGGIFNSTTGFGVTSGLNTSLIYDYPDNTPYSYNLSYLGHEIGHNFGSPHTHNCNWDADPSLNFPGGAIDACSDVEGNCDPPNNPPNESWQQSIGTIMSYCDFNIGITLEFHQIVEAQALIPGVNNASCLNTCDELESSCGNSIYGCTDSIAENFNPEANIDDNTCQYIYGCMSPNADNYNSNATMDDGSCICSGSIDLYIATDYYSNEVSWELIDDNGLVIDGGGNYFQGGEIIFSSYCLAEGCYQFNIYDSWGDGLSSNNTAGNDPNYYIYHDNASCVDGSVIPGNYVVQMNNIDFGSQSIHEFCLIICDADNDCDGVCDEDEITGCTDSSYFEYNPNATDDDGTCLTLIIEGCTDSIACNYDSESNLDDDSCEYPPNNFDCDGNCLVDTNNDGVCDILGCTNSDACNFDEDANIDDNNCDFPAINFDCDGNCLIDIDCSGECGGIAVFDDCGVCNGDNSTCLGCTDILACNYDNLAIIDNGECDFPVINFDCDGNCLVDVDCSGECGGSSVFDECGECGGNGPEQFYDCSGNCLSDLDLDGICDQIDNCIEDFNPNQIDNDGDGYGDECSCQYIDILGEVVVEAGTYQVYTLSNEIDNMAAWQVDGGEIVWSSAVAPPSIGVQWLEIGLGTISITQYFGVNSNCTVELNVDVTPSSIKLLENLHTANRQIIIATDILGRTVNAYEKGMWKIYIYNDGSIEKKYELNK